MKSLTTLLLTLSLTQHATAAAGRVYEFSYDSHLYGRLGSFLVTEENLMTKLGQVPGLNLPYMLNNYIADLNFAFKGTTWTKEDISIGPYVAHAFDTTGPLPILFSANGALAIKEGSSITMYHPSIGVLFGSEYVLGNWVTSIVPEPTSMACVLAGVVMLHHSNRRTRLRLLNRKAPRQE